MNEKLQVVLDATMFDLLQLCPCRFNYRFNLNRVSETKAKPLDRGTLVHVGMENYFLGLKDKLPFKTCIDRMIVSTRAANPIVTGKQLQ